MQKRKESNGKGLGLKEIYFKFAPEIIKLFSKT